MNKEYLSCADTAKLVRKAWPGPLTLVYGLSSSDLDTQKQRLDDDAFETLYKNGSIGIRCPDHPAASLLLRMADCPVVAPSANMAGDPPATNADQAVTRIGDHVDLTVSATPVTLQHKHPQRAQMFNRQIFPQRADRRACP